MIVENVNGTELRFKNPGRLLLVVVSFLFLGVGFLDMLGHTSAEPDIFGLYSLPFFALILLYAGVIVFWVVLFFNSRLLDRIAQGVRTVQNNTFLAFAAFAACGIALWVIFEWNRWSRVPGLQFAAFGLVVQASLILLLANWDGKNSRQVWRKIIAYPLLVLVIVEVVLQGLALVGWLPGVQTIGGHFYPYERVYYQGESTLNGFANRYGWYYPDAALDNNKKRILVVGGSYVQALQVEPKQQAGMLLAEWINQEQADPSAQVEIIPISMPGFGLTPFLYEEYINELPSIIDFDEIIVIFHLGDDFQSPVQAHNPLAYTLNTGNKLEIFPEDAQLRHDLTHYYLRAFMSLQLVETVRSNYLTPKVIDSLLRGNGGATTALNTAAGMEAVDFPRLVGFVKNTYAVTEPGHAGIKETALRTISEGNNFMFSQAGAADRREAIRIAENLLMKAAETARAKNITLRVVTVPQFPAAFYTSYHGTDWEPQLGAYDLFLPEQALIQVAAQYDIPILAMGEYMEQDGLTVEEIRSFYLPGNEGFFTEAGHRYFAEAIYSVFFQQRE